ncbi:hypothetical protein [Streptomyces sp. NPDC005407]|uniref:hypothetical protein n=1 Tax=Streptomyces sp. NPDC005407 TaxID=3155340 RepID=UPI0033B3477D
MSVHTDARHACRKEGCAGYGCRNRGAQDRKQLRPVALGLTPAATGGQLVGFPPVSEEPRVAVRRAALRLIDGVGVPVRTLSPILLAYSVPGRAGGSLVGTAAAVLAFPVAGGVWDVDAAEAVAEGA